MEEEEDKVESDECERLEQFRSSELAEGHDNSDRDGRPERVNDLKALQQYFV